MVGKESYASDPNVQAIRESFGRVVYTHKTHEKAREIESTKAIMVKIINIFLTAVTSTSLVTTIFTDEHFLLYVSSVLSAATLAFTIFQLSFDPSQEAERHCATARELWYVREQYINLLADARDSVDSVNLRRRRDELTSDLKRIYGAEPNTSPRAYKRAQAALKVSEDMTFSDDEINRFLPNVLQIGG